MKHNIFHLLKESWFLYYGEGTEFSSPTKTVNNNGLTANSPTFELNKYICVPNVIVQFQRYPQT
jgi:hypothetical protein